MTKNKRRAILNRFKIPEGSFWNDASLGDFTPVGGPYRNTKHFQFIMRVPNTLCCQLGEKKSEQIMAVLMIGNKFGTIPSFFFL